MRFFQKIKDLFNRNTYVRNVRLICTGELIDIIPLPEDRKNYVVFVRIDDKNIKAFTQVIPIKKVDIGKPVSVFRDQFNCFYMISVIKPNDVVDVVSKEESLRR